MDPEPGRCRRTDGRKWRCRRNVVPDQKYCDGHMHRGRQRSRKHVEVCENNISVANARPTSNSKKTSPITNPHDFTNTNPKSPIQVPKRLQQIDPSSNMGDEVTFTSKTLTTSSSNSNGRSCGNESLKSKIGRSSDMENMNSGNHVAAGFSYSAECVLQDSSSCGASSLDYRTLVEAEPERCRRTDGKKWRRGRGILPEQKYCRQHMDRGVKRLAVESRTVTVPKASLPAIPKKKVDDNGMNTSLSVSLVASTLQIPDYENDLSSGSSSSSEATTVTAENTTLSP